MSDIPYLDTGDSPTAERWNTLWQEMDRKLSLALDHHSLLFFRENVTAGGTLGRKFFFIEGAQPRPRGFSQEIFTTDTFGNLDPDYVNYDHGPFTAAALAVPLMNSGTNTTLPPIWCDQTRKILRIEQPAESYYTSIGRVSAPGYNPLLYPFFDFSLEAHKRRFAPRGSGATGTAVISGGKITRINITNGGSGYARPPLVVITGNGTGATADCAIFDYGMGGRNDSVTAARMLTQGTGYTAATVQFVSQDAATPEADFWLMSGNAGEQQVERIHRYDHAELIFDGSNYQTFDFPPNWNKYNFFRAHNLNAYEMKLRFVDGNNAVIFEVTIPAFGSKCVRRDSVSEGYELCFNHFFKVHAGDPRCYNAGEYAGSVNNVVNPQIAWTLLGRFISGAAGGGPRVYLDEKKFWDASGTYCAPLSPLAPSTWLKWIKSIFTGVPAGGYFGPLDDSTLIGDLLHHRGQLVSVKTTTAGAEAVRQAVSFRGYDRLVDDFTSAGLAVTKDADDQIVITGSIGSGVAFHDLVSISTNILTAATGYPARTIVPGITIPNFTSGQPAVPVDARNTSAPATWRSFVVNSNVATLGPQTLSTDFIVPTLFESVDADESYRKLPIHSLTLGELKRLNAVGSGLYTSTNQDTFYSAFTGQQVRFTGFGPILHWTRTTDFLARPLANVYNAGSDSIDTSTGSPRLVQKFLLHFTGQGFPAYQPRALYNFFGFLVSAGEVDGAFISPRVEPFFGEFEWNLRYNTSGLGAFSQAAPYWFPSRPDYRDYRVDSGLWATEDCQDSKVKPIPKFRRKSGVGILLPFTLANSYARIAAWFNRQNLTVPDPLFGPQTADTSSTAWYGRTLNDGSTNRQRLLANTFNDGAVSVGQSTFDYMPLLVDHYNNLASVVNAITRVSQLDFVSFYFTSKTILDFERVDQMVLPNTSGLYGSTVRPWNQYARYDVNPISGDPPDAQVAFWQLFGVPIKSVADLPASYTALLIAKQRNVISPTEFSEDSPGSFLSRTWQTLLFDGAPYSTISLNNSSYTWITISDVKAAAEAIGFKLFHQTAGNPLKLELTDVSIGAALAHPGSSSGWSSAARGRFAAMTPPDSLVEVEWIRTLDTYRICSSTAAADVLSVPNAPESNAQDVTIYQADIPERFRVRNWPRFANPLATQPLLEADRHYGSILFLSYQSTTRAGSVDALVPGSSLAIQTPAPRLDWGTGFSQASANSAIGRSSLGTQIIGPPTTIPASGSATSATMAAGANLITPATDSAQEVTLFQNRLIDV